MVHAVEITFDICLESKPYNSIFILCSAQNSAVSCYLSKKQVEPVKCSSCSFAFAAGVAINNKPWLKDRLKHIHKRMVHNTIAKITHTYGSRLWVAQDESLKGLG